jgi:glucose/arabinose dehydrogenase
VGLESVLPYTFLYPNPAIQHLPFTFSESREKFPLFGSVLEIKKGQLDNSYSLVARGFRSPQGLYYDQKRKVLFNSDHGPRGGDEINIIRLDKHSTPDYGWPNVTLGDYYSERGNLKTTFLTHFGYENPIYFWTPSIAPSQVIVFNGFKKVSEFDESVLLATLKSQSIYRIFFDSDYKVKNIEAIYIGKRIRDLDKFQTFIVGGTDTGELFILEDSGTSTHDGAFPKFETPQTPISSGIIDYIRLFTNKVKAFLS